jgi:putative hemolysin
MKMKGLAHISLSLKVKYEQNKFAMMLPQGTKAGIKKYLRKYMCWLQFLPTFATR